ncbi:allantoate amidohydrolase [Aureimonas fodinaquatilis]|uniref:Allantoate amidohydrolase n=2 Tax=Aureimonas fodinaquatilis TaxID=2565783 RepID=A0A5B0E2Z9_9HYPH|nr:allantoate amidohydrolase [Aureimonas fodinaquatilis]
MQRLNELAKFSSEPDQLTRLYLSTAHRQAAVQVLQWMQEAGLSADMDAVGNVVGQTPGLQHGEKRLILGSHIDTVRNAGRYDGTLGVVVAIEAMDRLARMGAQLPLPVEIVAFGDEEGVRFPVTLTGSRALAGTVDPQSLAARDADGVSLHHALLAFGGAPDAIAGVARAPGSVAAYVEVHIEQGPVLEAQGAPTGIVTGIAGAVRAAVSVTGLAGHSGTVPMSMRRDALAGAAQMIGEVEAVALATPGLVATVGQIQARPGAVNVIPGAVTFSLDVRSLDDATRHAAIQRLRQVFSAIASQRSLMLDFVIGYDERTAPCAEHLQTALAAAIHAENLPEVRLASGAGHDGLAMMALCPIAMLFVRCKGGISHHPDEAILEEDAEAAVRVLMRFLQNPGLSMSR